MNATYAACMVSSSDCGALAPASAADSAVSRVSNTKGISARVGRAEQAVEYRERKSERYIHVGDAPRASATRTAATAENQSVTMAASVPPGEEPGSR
jgi:hypothetical protein